jgi:hypothetical protein
VNAAETRARRCPGGILGFWAWQASTALVVAWPAASLVRAAFGTGARADAVLWDAGAHPLLVLLTREARGVQALASGAALVLVGAALAGVVPTAALMVAMARAGSTRRGWAGVARTAAGAIRCLPAFAILTAAALVAQAVTAATAVFLGRVAGAVGETSLGEARAHLVGWIVTGVALLPILALGIAHDLARAAVVRSRASAGRAVVLGVSALWRGPAALSWAWAGRALAGLALVAAGAAAAATLSPRGGAALIALVLIHQGVILARIALRASWLARALRAMSRPA